jgi:hypothetical protein
MLDERDFEDLTFAQLALEVFAADLTFIINDIDMSWKAEIPMLHFARAMFVAAMELVPEKPVITFISPDLVPVTTFALEDHSIVSVRRQGVDWNARCERAELIESTAEFGVRVFTDFIGNKPGASKSEFLRAWYPLNEMRLQSKRSAE